MNDRDKQSAQKLFRQEAQKRDGAIAWSEYTAQEEATRQKTAKLKALRLARETAAASAGPAAKLSKKNALPRA